MKSNKQVFIKDKEKFVKRALFPAIILICGIAFFMNYDKILLQQHKVFTSYQVKKAKKSLDKYQKVAKESALNSANAAISEADLKINDDGTISLKPNNKSIRVESDGSITFVDKKSAKQLVALKEKYQSRKQHAKIYAEASTLDDVNEKLAQLYKIKADESQANIESVNNDLQADDTSENKARVERGELVYPSDPIKAQFLQRASEAAKIVAARNQLLPSIMVAQAVIESDWGRSGLAKNDLNFFGVKYRGSGDYSEWETVEYYDGVATKIIDKFQKYSSMEDSFQSNADVLRTVTFDHGQTYHYSGAWLENVKDADYPYIAAANGLQGRYATAPDYADILIKMIQTYGLNYLDSEVLSQSSRLEDI